MGCCLRSGNQMTRWATNLAREVKREVKLPVNKVINKVTWQQVGHVTEPGRYMFRFGWLTIAPDDLTIWMQYPDTAFTLVQTSGPEPAVDADTPNVETEEFHLGAFELHANDEFRRQHAAA
jgi:hypothetical protein